MASFLLLNAYFPYRKKIYSQSLSYFILQVTENKQNKMTSSFINLAANKSYLAIKFRPHKLDGHIAEKNPVSDGRYEIRKPDKNSA